MQLSQLNPVKDNPVLGKVIKQNIRTIIHLRTKDAKASGPQSRVAGGIACKRSGWEEGEAL